MFKKDVKKPTPYFVLKYPTPPTCNACGKTTEHVIEFSTPSSREGRICLYLFGHFAVCEACLYGAYDTLMGVR